MEIAWKVNFRAGPRSERPPPSKGAQTYGPCEVPTFQAFKSRQDNEQKDELNEKEDLMSFQSNTHTLEP